MVQLQVLSGQMAGTAAVARHFPFHIGRAQAADLVLPDPGVWDSHLILQFEAGDGFYAVAEGNALLTVNGAGANRQRLSNGDRIELGGAVVQFWLGETRQRGLRIPEWLVWIGVTLVTAVQVCLILKLR